MANNLDRQYKELLEYVMRFGNEKSDRTGTGTKSIFSWELRHNMKEGFPLLTTKKMYWKGIVTELLWFLRGETNIKYLVDNGCHIWDGDAYKNFETTVEKNKPEGYTRPTLTKEEFIHNVKIDPNFAKQWGDLGPVYGKQWRDWEPPETYADGCIDQIANLISELKTNPDSRRLMVNAWNVGEIKEMVLPPCHYGFQVYTRELSNEERFSIQIKRNDYQSFYTKEELHKNNIPTRAISLKWNQRSVDTFLGLPFNIASYGLLLCILGEIVNMVPEELIGSLGDVHIYNNHIEQAKEQLNRKPFDLPTLSINTEFWAPGTDEGCGMGAGTYSPSFDGLVKSMEISDFKIENYQSHPAIKAPLSN